MNIVKWIEKLNCDFYILCKMFIRVAPEKLVIGTKYKIAVLINQIEFDKYSGVFKESTIYPSSTYLEFEKCYNLKVQKCIIHNVFFVHNSYHYYEFVSGQPQWNMERRAVNNIMRRLIGDDCFEW